MTRVLVLLALLTACGGGSDNPMPAPTQPVAPPVAEDAGGGETGTESEDRLLNYPDEVFVEAETSRDPFRRYATVVEVRTTDPRGPPVPMGNVSVDDVRLIAIISGVPNPAAMLVDPSGVGYTVRRGEAICRPEIVQTGGAESVAVPLHWRVERIRDDAIVLSREDRTGPNRPPITRVIQLHEDPRPRP